MPGDGNGVLVVDETGFLKKGTHSVGVARQYSGFWTAGRVENCGVFLGYARRLGQALIDRRLHLPEAWAEDDTRRSRVQIPKAIMFATKPEIACDLISTTLDAGVPNAWVLADALYGSDSRPRHMLESRRQAYVLAVRSNHHLRFLTKEGPIQTNSAELANEAPAEAWSAQAASEGSKGIKLTIGHVFRCPGSSTRASNAGC